MKGLIFSILLFLLFSGLILVDALLVKGVVSDMETALATVSSTETGGAEAVQEIKSTLEQKHFLFSVSLPYSVIEEAEGKVLALELAVKKGLKAETQKEKEALALCLARMRRGALPSWAELL